VVRRKWGGPGWVGVGGSESHASESKRQDDSGGRFLEIH
jgi:hypothetical protein